MDIFSRKKVRELEDKLRIAERERDDYKSEVYELRDGLKSIEKAIDSTPKDCIRGSWCQACEFGKELTVSGVFRNYTFCVCGKGDSCKNFIQKV